MSARDFRVTRATVHRPDERFIRDEDRTGPSVAVMVESSHLRSKPIDVVRLTDDEALCLAAELLNALRNKQGQR